MTHGSLFAGIGGFDLGFERAEFETVWQVEINEFCRKVLAKNFPHAQRFGDIRECGKHNLQWVDVITGGFPCQDISRAGLLAGIDGKRSGLWREMHRIICELRPRIVVVENVAALLDGGISRVLGDLAACGYDAEWDCIPAAAVGTAHIRDRVFILAYSGCQPRAFQKGCSVNGCDELEEQRGDGNEAQRRANRKLIALVPGVHSGALTHWWRTQSGVDRSVDDFPERLDRLAALGNAVVPEVAYWIAERIKQAEESYREAIGESRVDGVAGEGH